MSTETTENVVKSTDVAPKKTPKSFNDLSLPELQAAARAFGEDETGNKAAIKAALLEAGVEWKDYVKMFQLEGHEDIPEPPVVEPLKVELTDDDDEEETEEVNEEVTVQTAPQVAQLAPQADYLIKFIGENPYFEFRKYKFTQDKPFGIMPAADAQLALVSEPKKFRQAFPDELQEFYG